MTSLIYDVLNALHGKTLATAESCTGGGIGAAITAIPGSSRVYKGGVISYTNEIKEKVLGVPGGLLESCGAVSGEVAMAMADGARRLLQADVAVSVTGLAGPDGDDRGNPVGLVYIGYCDGKKLYAEEYRFSGSRQDVQSSAIAAALELIYKEIK